MLLLSKFIFICFAVSFAASAQSKVSLSILFCRSDEIVPPYPANEFWLFRNDSLMKHYENVAAGIIGEFPDGDYAIEYKTIFGVRSEQFKLKFEKDRSNLHELKLCVDDLSPELRAKTSALFIDLLKDDEEIVIDYSFSGCFASGKESMIIKKHRGIYYILYKETKRKLLDKEVSALRDMELELRNLTKADYGCTTNSKTTVTYKSASISFSEPCGYWEGYYRIKGILELE